MEKNPEYLFVMDRDAAIGTDGAQLAKEIVESLGGRSASDVSKSTDFLVSDGKVNRRCGAKK